MFIRTEYKKVLISVVTVLIIVIIGGGIFFLKKNESKDKKNIGLGYTSISVDLTSKIIPNEYGNDYNGDWSLLKNGKELCKKEMNINQFLNKNGDNSRLSYLNQELVQISDLNWKIKWNNPYSQALKYKNSLIYVKGAKKVIIENINIYQMDSDYRASSTIFLEDCEEVIIRHCFISGTSEKPHIRIEGCRKVLIEYVEIAGYDYGAKGIRSGAGIYVENSPDYVYSKNPYKLEWSVIQHCYIHDNLSADKFRNDDGIIVQSASNGLLFNCYFENWGHSLNNVADGAIDISHRTIGQEYAGAFYRIERNIFNNCRSSKISGGSDLKGNLVSPDCVIFLSNNSYYNTTLSDYHKSGDVFHVHETFLYDDFDEDGGMFLFVLGLSESKTYIKNCLIFSKRQLNKTLYYIGSSGMISDWKRILPDSNAYVYKSIWYWLRINEQLSSANNIVKNSDSWINGSGTWFSGTRDKNSTFEVLKNNIEYFTTTNNEYFIPTIDNPANKTGCNDFIDNPNTKMNVERDFNGKKRSSGTPVGAFL